MRANPHRSTNERTSEYRDITIEAFETLAADSSYIGLEYEEQGKLDEQGKFIADWASRLRPIGEEDADR